MTPSDIIREFQLDTAEDRQKFLIAADVAEENGLLVFAQLLREKSHELFEPFSHQSRQWNFEDTPAISRLEEDDAEVNDSIGLQYGDGAGYTGDGAFGQQMADHDGSGVGIGYGEALESGESMGGAGWGGGLKWGYGNDFDYYFWGDRNSPEVGHGLGQGPGYGEADEEWKVLGAGRGDGVGYGDSDYCSPERLGEGNGDGSSAGVPARPGYGKLEDFGEAHGRCGEIEEFYRLVKRWNSKLQ